jgi:hypothetical protein
MPLQRKTHYPIKRRIFAMMTTALVQRLNTLHNGTEAQKSLSRRIVAILDACEHIAQLATDERPSMVHLREHVRFIGEMQARLEDALTEMETATKAQPQTKYKVQQLTLGETAAKVPTWQDTNYSTLKEARAANPNQLASFFRRRD